MNPHFDSRSGPLSRSLAETTTTLGCLPCIVVCFPDSCCQTFKDPAVAAADLRPGSSGFASFPFLASLPVLSAYNKKRREISSFGQLLSGLLHQAEKQQWTLLPSSRRPSLNGQAPWGCRTKRRHNLASARRSGFEIKANQGGDSFKGCCKPLEVLTSNRRVGYKYLKVQSGVEITVLCFKIL